MQRFFGLVLIGCVLGCGSPATDAPLAETSTVPTTPTVFNAEGAPVVEFDAPGMHCEACAANIVKAVREQPGVVDVKADAATKVVTVAVTEAEFETDFAIEAIAEAGFGEATPIETVDPIEEAVEPAEES